MADASRPSSAVRVLVHPCNVQSELGPWDTRGSGGGGGRRRGGVAEKDEEGRYYAVTVVCRHSPRLLEAVLSSLRSAGGEKSLFREFRASAFLSRSVVGGEISSFRDFGVFSFFILHVLGLQ